MPNLLATLCLCGALLCYPPGALTARPVARISAGGANPWRSFGRLIDAERGNSVHGLAGLKRYFAKFGYLPELAEKPPPDDVFDEEFESAVKYYQSRLGLETTGRLDAVTLGQIMSPRCGVRDAVGLGAANGSRGVERFAFFEGEPRWARPSPLVLTYAVSKTATIGYLPRSVVSSAFKRAFERWAQVIPVQFVEASEYSGADVKIGFYSYDHGDGEPFDGPLGILAHAFSPESGRLHLDAAERWAVDMEAEKAKSAIDLESVATHEIGHVLGLAHSPVPGAVMYPSLKPRSRKVQLTIDDVQGVQLLYGSNPLFRISSLSASSDTSAAAPQGNSVGMNGAVVGLAVVTLRLLVDAALCC